MLVCAQVSRSRRQLFEAIADFKLVFDDVACHDTSTIARKIIEPQSSAFTPSANVQSLTMPLLPVIALSSIRVHIAFVQLASIGDRFVSP